MVQSLALSILVFAAAGAAVAQTAPPASPRRVVFVCEHGVAKSVVAATHFNRLAAARGLPLRAISRGTAPDARVPALVSDGLRADGAVLDPAFVPSRVAAADTEGAVRVVTFDLQLPADVQAAAVTNWTGVPNFSDGYAQARADIVRRVEALLEELAAARR